MPGRCQAFFWINVEILLIRPLRTNFSGILIEIHTFSLKKMHLKMSSGRWGPFCLGIKLLTISASSLECGQSGIQILLPNRHINNNNVVITSQRLHFDAITSKWRRFTLKRRYYYVMCSVGSCSNFNGVVSKTSWRVWAWLSNCVSTEIHCSYLSMSYLYQDMLKGWSHRWKQLMSKFVRM